MRDPYEALGVSSEATDEELARAYKALARKYHPDLNPGDAEAERRMKEVNSAYGQIKDIRSGKAPQPGQGAGAARDGQPFGQQQWGDFGDFGNFGGFGGFYGRYARRDDTGRQQEDDVPRRTVRLIRFPILRLILVIILFRLLFSFVSFFFNGGYSAERYSPYGYGQTQQDSGQSD